MCELLNKCTEHTASEEGFRAKPYKDTVGVLTIGYGINLEKGITEEEAQLILRHRLKNILLILTYDLPFFNELPDDAKIGLCDMAYQLGAQGLLKFKRALKSVEEKNWAEAKAHFLDSKWARQTPNRAKRVVNLICPGK